ncbi:MAG: hypothetical protein CO071_03500, partial [Gallionellales bacterium CG_4_9_14_0_8_um_filter_59_50]
MLAVPVAHAADMAQLLQQLTPEQMQQLQQLSPEQRAALMQRASTGNTQPNSSPVAAPANLPPRSLETGRLEADAKTDSRDASLSRQEITGGRTADIPLEQVKSQAVADQIEIRRSYEEFMRESKPMEVDTASLRQYGYDLFASEPSSFAPVTDVPVPPEYVLGPGDEIKVQLFGKDNK